MCVCVIFLHIDAAVAATVGECFIADTIIVRELHARAEIHAPPGIMDEVSTRVIVNGVVNRRRWIPVWRSRRVGRGELGRRLARQNRPMARKRGKFNAPGGHMESTHEVAILIQAQGLLNHRNDDDLPRKVIVLDKLLVSLMRLVIGRFVGIILF